ncbi:hypothetical protein ACRRTK_017919 [Alexandromys fortis]
MDIKWFFAQTLCIDSESGSQKTSTIVREEAGASEMAKEPVRNFPNAISLPT